METGLVSIVVTRFFGYTLLKKESLSSTIVHDNCLVRVDFFCEVFKRNFLVCVSEKKSEKSKIKGKYW